MDGTIIQLLQCLSRAMGTDNKAVILNNEIDYSQLFMLSQIHHVAPMIYPTVKDVLATSEKYMELSVEWRKVAICNIMNQYKASERFLQIYEKLIHAGVKALVTKGIVLRQLYPEPDSRISSDEDIYIDKSDFQKVHQILIESDMQTDMAVDRGTRPCETVYTMKDSKWILEVHTSLFDPDMKLFSGMNHCFVDAFDQSITLRGYEQELLTLSHTHHLLFLLLHAIKHFCGSGVGIRQICDVVMYCNAYGAEVDFDFVWKGLSEFGFDILALNLFDIGIRYLGLDVTKYHIPTRYKNEDIHSEALLLDLMSSGIYGKCKPDEGTTRVYTLNSIIQQRYKNREPHKPMLIMHAIFPDRQYLGYFYRYCQEYPYLIIVAWFHRILRFILKEGKPSRIICKVLLQLQFGTERIELMKEYKVINR